MYMLAVSAYQYVYVCMRVCFSVVLSETDMGHSVN